MININLLPWRDVRRERLQRVYLLALGLIAGGGLIALVWVYVMQDRYYQDELAWQDKLQQELVSLSNRELELTTLSQSSQQLVLLKVKHSQQRVEKLQRVLQLLSENPVAGIYFWRVQLLEKYLLIKGRADHEKNISQVIQLLSRHGWKLQLKSVGHNQKDYSFALRILG